MTPQQRPPTPLTRNAANERPETFGNKPSDSSLASPRPKPKRRSLGAVEPAPEATSCPRPERWDPSHAVQSLYVHRAA